GVRNNISVSLQYLESWLRGSGCVPINNLMEDAATVEIARAQIWQWIHHPEGILSDGRDVTLKLVRQMMAEELGKLKSSIGEEHFTTRRFATASQILDKIVSSDQFVEFLTLPAYEILSSEQ